VNTLSHTARSWMLLVLATVALGSFGCAATGTLSSSARYDAATPGPAHASTRDVEMVEVLLDSKPQRPFVVTGELSIKTQNNPASILAMRQRAAEAGLDGIYWIDCTSPCSGTCSAKGFVYADHTNVASR